jgi:hypothetical protein
VSDARRWAWQAVAAGVLSGAVALVGACGGHRDALIRGQRYYEESRYELALALLKNLERETARLSPGERLRYAYLRGMTDYRLGYRLEARHWLGLASVPAEAGVSTLDPRWLPRLEAALADLEREARGAGADGADPVQAIEILPPPGASPGSHPSAHALAPDGGVR